MPNETRRTARLHRRGATLDPESARGFWAASQRLNDHPREANVLESHAEEEAAKILILLDVVRCPEKLSASKTGRMMKWFYDHLARLIYAKAASWKPMDVSQLQEYVNSTREAHYLEGEYGQYIMPNWKIFARESRMYVDVEIYEGGERGWNKPQSVSQYSFNAEPAVLRIADALSALGVFSHKGLQATANIWDDVTFSDKQNYSHSQILTEQLLTRLIEEKLPTESAKQEHVAWIYNCWQMPMYNIDFSLIPVPLDELQQQRDAMFYAEVGYY
jgi:hypothetical protein